jgi:hypothetical protein|tara:strand:+ start:498 stop:1133 length:636 start_codon:yes stop_codon:yes gene_type:complete
MKGQFFISSIVVISVVLILSLSFANTANTLSVEIEDTTEKLNFENYKNAYNRSVYGWDDVNFNNRRKLLLCANVSGTTVFNTTKRFPSAAGNCANDVYSPDATIYINSTSTASCTVFVDLSIIDTSKGYNCSSIYVYYNNSAGSKSTSAVGAYSDDVTVGAYENESVFASPRGHFRKNYAGLLVSVDETGKSGGLYNGTYKSEDIVYNGTI